VFRTKSEIEKKSDGSTGLNQSRKHKLIETGVTQIGAIFLVPGFRITDSCTYKGVVGTSQLRILELQVLATK
jgi:hypothetical protein